jgi:transposase
MISKDLVAEIRRLFTIEGWPRNTIARHLSVHHGTVYRALLRAGLLEKTKIQRPSLVDDFVPFIKETLERYPRLGANVLYEMVRKRGYRGGPDHFRHRIRQLGLRPRRAPEAFLRLRTLPGQEAQVDWAHFGERKVAGGVRTLWAFVMVLSFSRMLFVRFFFDARLPSFLAGHVAAFAAFGGLARRLLYDNLKSAVLEREGLAIRFHPKLLELADHYGFDPRPTAPARGNEKGRVERAIRYLRSSFFPLRASLSLEALNEEARDWCQRRASQRPWPQDHRRSVEGAFLEERTHLLELPCEPLPVHEVVPVRVRRTPYVAFDANRYSVPHEHIDRQLVILAETDLIRILDSDQLIASHQRCWGKGQVIEDERHLAALWQSKKMARQNRGQGRLLAAVPRAEQLLVELARRQRHLVTAIDRLLRMLDEYGARELATAIDEALTAGSPHPETVRLVLDRRAARRGAKPPLPISLPDDPKIRDLVVTPHKLSDYDPEDAS